MKLRFVILSVVLLAAAGCLSGPGYVMVQAEIPAGEGGALEKADKIYFLDFLLAMSDKSYDPTEQIRRYFSEDFAAFVSKKIVPVASEGWEKVRHSAGVSGFNFNAPAFFQELLAAYPQAVFITGRIGGEIKTTSVIREVRDEKGGKRNAFVQQQLWDTDAQVYVIDAASGKILAERTNKDKTAVTEAVSPRFQYERLLEKITEKLQPDLQRQVRRQERYILLK